MIVAITGGIGSGKSLALKTVEDLGYYTVSCDDIVKEAYNDRYFLKEIKKLFPSSISGFFRLKVDKSVIADEIFHSVEKRKALENLLHPFVLYKALKKAKGRDLTFVEVPLLFENGYQKYFDKVFVIKRKMDERLKAVKKRSNLKNEEILLRVEAQIDYDKTDFSAYTVIENNADKEALKDKLIIAIDQLYKEKNAKKA